MPRLEIFPEEWWPVLTLRTYDGGYVEAGEFTEAEIADLKRVEAEFATWQNKIAERFGRRAATDAVNFRMVIIDHR